MKKEMLDNLKVLNESLEGIEVKGHENVFRMRDAFFLVDGLFKYASNLPDEEEVQEEQDRE